MNDHELLQAIFDMVTPMKLDIETMKNEMGTVKSGLSQAQMDISGIKVLMETEMKQSQNLLAEGQENHRNDRHFRRRIRQVGLILTRFLTRSGSSSYLLPE